MTRLTIIRPLAILALFATLAAAACGSPGSESGVAESGAVYVDVRTPDEYAEGHVAGAILIPHDQMEARWQELAERKDHPVVVYCRTGRRSGLALDVLKAKGFTNVRNGGGLADLAAQGLSTTH